MLSPVRQRALDAVQRIVRDRLAGRQTRVYFFGDATRPDAEKWSTIKVAIDLKQPLPNDLHDAMLHDLEESTVPYFMDVVDLWKVPPDLLKAVRSDGIEWPL